MHAIRLHAFGPADNLRYEEVPHPVPAEDQVRIAVEAAGVHVVDTAIRRGEAGGPFPLPDLPMVPGREVAGTVDALGGGVDPGWLGRRVVAHLGAASGGYAERAVASVAALHAIPDHVGSDVAVAMIGTGRTALLILDAAGLTPDDAVLVTAAAGGLGSLLVQAARNAGAVVVGVAGGPAKREQIRALGATAAVDYLRPDWGERVREALGERALSVVLDGVGGPVGRRALELLGQGGRLVLFGWSSGAPTELTAWDLIARGLSATGLRRPASLRDLETRALEEAAAGRLLPLIGQRFPLARAAAAHTAIETRATVGKTVLVP
jgi:NADPH:quinone reductase